MGSTINKKVSALWNEKIFLFFSIYKNSHKILWKKQINALKKTTQKLSQSKWKRRNTDSASILVFNTKNFSKKMNIVKKKKIENVKVSAKNTEPFPKKKTQKVWICTWKKQRPFQRTKREKSINMRAKHKLIFLKRFYLCLSTLSWKYKKLFSLKKF